MRRLLCTRAKRNIDEAGRRGLLWGAPLRPKHLLVEQCRLRIQLNTRLKTQPGRFTGRQCWKEDFGFGDDELGIQRKNSGTGIGGTKGKIQWSSDGDFIADDAGHTKVFADRSIGSDGPPRDRKATCKRDWRQVVNDVGVHGGGGGDQPRRNEGAEDKTETRKQNQSSFPTNGP